MCSCRFRISPVVQGSEHPWTIAQNHTDWRAQRGSSGSRRYDAAGACVTSQDQTVAGIVTVTGITDTADWTASTQFPRECGIIASKASSVLRSQLRSCPHHWACLWTLRRSLNVRRECVRVMERSLREQSLEGSQV